MAEYLTVYSSFGCEMYIFIYIANSLYVIFKNPILLIYLCILYILFLFLSKEAHLKNLTSNIMYSNFDKGRSGCERISFYSSIKGEIEQRYPSIQIISEKILKALCFIYNEKRNLKNILDEEYCSYLFYWLGHNIREYLLDKSLFQKIVKMIYDELYSSDMYSTCTYLYEQIDEKNFNTYKLLFDYSKDHGNINLNTYHGHTTCDEHYKRVINNYINAYRNAHSNCTGTQENNFYCKYFNNLFSNEKYDKLTSFTCTERPYNNAFLEVPVDKVKEPDIGVLGNPASVANLNGVPRPTSSRDIDRNDYPNSYPHPYPNKGLADQHTLYDHPIPPVEDTTEGGSSKTIAGSVAPVLGVSSISLLLYKVTPLGGFIRNFLGRNRNMYNPVEYMDSFNPYNDGMDPGGRTMNISYHRL